MSSLDSYKRALTDLVDGQRRLTSELKKLRAVHEEQQQELTLSKQSIAILKTKVSQFSQFLRSTPSLSAAYKTAEYARLASEGDLTLFEPPKITAELSEFFKVLATKKGAVAQEDPAPFATNHLSRSIRSDDDGHHSPLSREGPNAVLSPALSTSSGLTGDGGGSTLPLLDQHTAPLASLEPTRVVSRGTSTKEHHRLFRSSATQTDASSSAMQPADAVLFAGAQQQLLGLALPAYLSTFSSGFIRDVQTNLDECAVTSTLNPPGSLPSNSDRSGVDSEDDAKGQQSLERRLASSQQRLAVAKSTAAHLRLQLQELLLKHQRTSAALVGAKFRDSGASPSARDVLFSDALQVPSGTLSNTSHHFVGSYGATLPSLPRPPTQGRALVSSRAMRSRGDGNGDLLNRSPPAAKGEDRSAEHDDVLRSVPLLLSYFVEDLCALLRESRFMMADLDAVHWRLAWFENGGSSPPDGGDARRTGKPNASPLLRRHHGNTQKHQPDHPFASCSVPALLRISEVLSGTLSGREAPRFGAWAATLTASPNHATGHRRMCSNDDGAHRLVQEVAVTLQECWAVLLQFLEGQLHHAQTMVFVREPRIREMIKQSPSLQHIVEAASGPD